MPTSEITDSKIINGLLSAAIIALISWNVVTTHDLSVQVAKIETKVDLLYAKDVQ